MTKVKVDIQYRMEEISIGCAIEGAPSTPASHQHKLSTWFVPDWITVTILDGKFHRFDVSGRKVTKAGRVGQLSHRETYYFQRDEHFTPQGAEWLWDVARAVTGHGPTWEFDVPPAPSREHDVPEIR